MVKKYIWWVAVSACMIAIFLFSNQKATDSTQLSDGLLFDIIKFFSINASNETIAFLSVFIRKVAHFCVYAVLGVSTYMLVVTNFGKNGKKAIFTALIVCALYAVTDEVHQLFIEGRSGSGKDVLLDSAGALFGISFIHTAKKLFLRRNKNG